jgi:[ribosomal protein S18]-alanine N-acetyltransferase
MRCTRRAPADGVGVLLREAGAADRPELERLLAAYLFEFDGRTEPYPYLDAYWTEAERLPFLIEVDGRPVGICLIRVRDGGWSIAEFSVDPSQRRAGVGRAAVEALAERAREAGARHLEAKIHPDNGGALLFWSAVGFEQVPSTTVVTTRRPL